MSNFFAPRDDTYRRFGGWLGPPEEKCAPLESDVTGDVVVIGAGYAGLSTALELRARGADVVVLEREFAGSGASGRNAGYLAGGTALAFPLVIQRHGRERAAAMVHYLDEGVRVVERRMKQFGIDCDYRPTGIIIAAVEPGRERAMRRKSEVATGLGAKSLFLSSDQMRARGIPPAFLCGALSEMGGTLDPGKYALGLRRAALAAGVRLYEDSPVTSIDEGSPARAWTDRGSVTAPFLVLATNGSSPAHPEVRRRIVPVRVSAIETEPLSPQQLAQLGWPNREGVVTAHNMMESHRLTPRNSLLITTKRVDYLFGGRTPEGPDHGAYRALQSALRDRHPTLSGVSIKARWTGWISFSLDTLPLMGVAGEAQNILYNAGCAGHGIGAQSLAGLLLAERVQGREHPLQAAIERTVPKLFPEPARWVVCKSMLFAINMADSRTNRQVRRLNAGGTGVVDPHAGSGVAAAGQEG